jgi:hypothetical protein
MVQKRTFGGMGCNVRFVPEADIEQDRAEVSSIQFLALMVSRNALVSRLRNSTSAGNPPPAEACPVTVPGEIVIT